VSLRSTTAAGTKDREPESKRWATVETDEDKTPGREVRPGVDPIR